MIRLALALACGFFSAAALAQSWNYRYADQQFGRHNYFFEVNEAPARGDGRIFGRSLPGGKSVLEYLPYALAEGEPAAWPQPYDYPTYATPYIEWKYTVKPEGWETVTVPGGTFKALRVTVSGERGKDPDPVWWPKQAMRFKQTFWYAPEAKRYVKMQHVAWSMDGAPFANELVELHSYRPGR
jgi:hypothetical protein